MKLNYKKKTWEALKIAASTTNNSIDYTEKKNRYKATLIIGDTTFFTNIFKPGHKHPASLDISLNDISHTDFINNFVPSINDAPPARENVIQLPLSKLDGKKLSVHTSSKPEIDSGETHAVWSGSGDDPVTGMICGGELLDFQLEPGKPVHSIDIVFDVIRNGRVWIHEGYLKFKDGGCGDYMSAEVIADPTILQQIANLDLLVSESGVITYSPGGPGTGTHGFADPNKIAPITRPVILDGGWDLDNGSLIPNFSNTGTYKLSTEEQIVHRYMNKLPTCGTCSSYFSMTSDESGQMLSNFRLRMHAYNNSDTTWEASVIMEIYRERTAN